MPQMAPISWLTLYIIFFLTFILFNIMNYYNFFVMIPNKNSQKLIKKTSFNWKW